MIYIIAGPSHVGKTYLSQYLIEKYKYPCLSIDLLKMGLIRSRNTLLTPLSSDRELTSYLWPIVCNMIKTALENNQNLIVEGCYIPFDYKTYFDSSQLAQIKYLALIFSKDYLINHFDDIIDNQDVIEKRLPNDYNLKEAIDDNALWLTKSRYFSNNYYLIDKRYPNFSLDLDV